MPDTVEVDSYLSVCKSIGWASDPYRVDVLRFIEASESNPTRKEVRDYVGYKYSADLTLDTFVSYSMVNVEPNGTYWVSSLGRDFLRLVKAFKENSDRPAVAEAVTDTPT